MNGSHLQKSIECESNGQRPQSADQHLHNSFKAHIPNRLLQRAHWISKRERLAKHWGWNCKALALKEFWGHASNTHQHFPLANSVLPWWHLQYLVGWRDGSKKEGCQQSNCDEMCGQLACKQLASKHQYRCATMQQFFTLKERQIGLWTGVHDKRSRQHGYQRSIGLTGFRVLWTPASLES